MTEALNARSIVPFDAAYNTPLPAPFADLLAGLIVDLINAEEPTDTPTPTATLTPVPIVDSPLPTPTP